MNANTRIAVIYAAELKNDLVVLKVPVIRYFQLAASCLSAASGGSATIQFSDVSAKAVEVARFREYQSIK